MSHAARWAKYLTLILCTCIFSSCGFHLRGTIDTPFWLDGVAIVVMEGDRELINHIQSVLEAQHIRVEKNPAVAPYLLVIEDEEFQKNIASISSSTTPRQYELVYRVNFKLENGKGQEVMPTCHVIVTRQITINHDRILGSTDEEELTKSEMRKNAAVQLINQLNRKKMAADVRSHQNHTKL